MGRLYPTGEKHIADMDGPDIVSVLKYGAQTVVLVFRSPPITFDVTSEKRARISLIKHFHFWERP